MEYAYWRHWDLFPANKKMHKADIQDLIITLLHGSVGKCTLRKDIRQADLYLVERFDHVSRVNGALDF